MKFIVVMMMITSLISCNNKEKSLIENKSKNEIAEINIDNGKNTDIIANHSFEVEYDYKSYIFDNDFNMNVSVDPFDYENNESFNFKEYFPEHDHTGTPQKYIEVKNEDVELVYYPQYFSITGKYKIQFITLKKYTEEYCFGNLINGTTELIVRLFSESVEKLSVHEKLSLNKVLESGNGYITFVSEGYINFVVFKFHNDILYEIDFGENI